MSGLHRPPLPSLDDAPGPATLLSKHGLAALRDRIVRRAGQRASRKRDLAWLRTPLGVAAACALAFASVGTGLAAVRVWPSLSSYLGGDAPEPLAAAPVASPSVSAKTRAESVAAPLPAEPSQLIEVVAPPTSTPPPQTVAHPRPLIEPRRRFAAALQDANARPVPLDLLQQANHLRGEQRWSQAEALYLRVLAADGDPSAHAAAALAAADLRLQHLGRARAALGLFERALRLQPVGPLAEQARHGIAKCHRSLKDELHEIEALNAYLHAHPQSPMAARNAARLRELTGSSFAR